MGFTEEQQFAIDEAAKGTSFALIAPAGSGKSTTALGMAQRLKGRRILYLVYNTAAREEAERKFGHLHHVDVRTTSQIGWRSFANGYAERMRTDAPHVPAAQIARMCNLQPIDFGGGLELDGYLQARLALDTIRRFTYSDHTRITERNVPLSVVGVEREVLAAARRYLAKLAWFLWRRSILPGSTLPFTMEHAFKLVSADEDRSLGYDVVLLDEAQDSNDCTMKFLRNQKGAQVILIGDPAQTLYGWRGSSDQILRFEGPKLRLTQSFRFGPAVAEEAAKHLAHTRTGVEIRGLPSIKDVVTDENLSNPDVILTRTNAGAMLYAMSYLTTGRRVAMVKGTKRILSLAYSAGALMRGERPKNVELSAFSSWEELVDYTGEPGGGHLKAAVHLIQVYGVRNLIDACKQMTPYNPRRPLHDVAVTTCHSIKGLEWRNVQIGDDFEEPEPTIDPASGLTEPGALQRSEAMVHYVAVTRAQKTLARGGLAWIDDYPAPKELDLV